MCGSECVCVCVDGQSFELSTSHATHPSHPSSQTTADNCEVIASAFKPSYQCDATFFERFVVGDFISSKNIFTLQSLKYLY